MGDNTWVGHEVLIVGGAANVIIGANCDIDSRVSLVTGSHRLDPVDGRAAGDGCSGAIRIGGGVWVGASTTVLGGVTVGRISMIAAGSLVRTDVPDNVVVAGVPAKQVRNISKHRLE